MQAAAWDPGNPPSQRYEGAGLTPSLPLLPEVKVLTPEPVEMAVAGGRRGPRAVPDLGILSDELHSCCIDANFPFVAFPAS